MNSAAAAPSRVRPRRRGVFPAVRRSGAARRSSARGANANSAGQILSLVRRVGRPSPRGTFSRGANPFARAPCREAFAVGSVSARGKSFRPCAVSRGLRRGECSRVGQILPTTPRHRKTTPRRRKTTAGRAQRAASAGEAAPVSVSQKRSCSSRNASASSPPAKTRARASSSSASARSAARRSCCDSSSRRSFI